MIDALDHEAAIQFILLKEGMTIALIGSEKQMHKFKDDYGASP